MIDSVQSLDRRKWLGRTGSGIAAPLLAPLGLAACSGPQTWDRTTVTVDRPGIVAGHKFGDISTKNWPDNSRKCQVLIIGSGVAALTAAWNLHRQGVRDLLLLSGPEMFGNAAGFSFPSGQSGPTGAHYLPLPSQESRHVREILKAMNVFAGEIGAQRPSYDESVLVHAPSERLLRADQWDTSLLPQTQLSQTAIIEQKRFFEYVARLSTTTGKDGRRLFVVPIVLASTDPEWTRLDTVPFKDWLTQSGYSDASLLWYLDYCCRDEYGAGIAQVSAWAGLHYFCSRAGHASNAEDGAVLTWPDGLATIARFLASSISNQFIAASAVQLKRKKDFVEVLAQQHSNEQLIRFQAEKVVLAVPLYVAARVDPELALAFPSWRELLPSYSPWIVTNFQLRHRPVEKAGSGLSWDNVVYQSRSLGFVNASHQLVRVNEFAPPVLTSYHAMTDQPYRVARQWCAQATDSELLALAGSDLEAAYGSRVWRHVDAAHVVVRAHGMPSPQPGFLTNPLLTQLRSSSGRVSYANADLSGYSVFEEAAWWGMQVQV